MTTFTMNQRRTRAMDWLEIIYKDVQDVLVDHHIFWEVQTMIKANEQLKATPSHFFQWMGTNFIASAAVAVRRQADADARAVSLRRLLEELKKYPDLFSRAYHTGLYGAQFPAGYADGCYDRIVGKGCAVLDAAAINGEIQLLIAKTDAIKHYVDRRVAHYDSRGITQAKPTFNDLDDCLKYLEHLVKRYQLLMKATSLSQLLPAFQYDWQKIFRIPWIEQQ